MRLRGERFFLSGAGLLLAIALAVVGAVVGAVAARRGYEQARVPATEPLTAYAPQGALMAVESPDFGALLSSWTNSDEEKAWLRSDNYAEFSRSRLFSRLGEAQSEFGASAGLPPDAAFLSAIAGKESLFAWYDIGKLEFLYVTRMEAGKAASNPLMKLADKFQMRRAGADSFYVRSEKRSTDGIDPAANQGGNGGVDEAAQTDVSRESRTVAFAVHGDLLMIATRGDLIANALLLAQHQGDANLGSEPWYTAATSAAATEGKSLPDLRMTLNLAKLVPSPYFRSYWVQRNVTETKQYGAAVSDLYRTKDVFREQRVLILKQAGTQASPGGPGDGRAGGQAADLNPILQFLPGDSGVYRASAVAGAAEIVAQLESRLLAPGAAAYRDEHVAPVADLSDVSPGSSADLEMRIDEPPLSQDTKASSLAPLRGLIDESQPDTMLVYSTRRNMGGGGATPVDPVFVPTHAGVVVSAVKGWDETAVRDALAPVLRARLTVGGGGPNWQARRDGDETWMEFSGLQPVAMKAQGKFLIVASDSATLLKLLRSARMSAGTSGAANEYAHARTVAGFRHSSERGEFARLSGLLNQDAKRSGTTPGTTLGTSSGTASGTSSPAFFSDNVGSLSETFRRMDSERFVEERLEDRGVRQTVTYEWKR